MLKRVLILCLFALPCTAQDSSDDAIVARLLAAEKAANAALAEWQAALRTAKQAGLEVRADDPYDGSCSHSNTFGVHDNGPAFEVQAIVRPTQDKVLHSIYDNLPVSR